MKKGEVDSKMLSALLTGVNRAYPFAKGKPSTMLKAIMMVIELLERYLCINQATITFRFVTC